ncbi:YbjQ family protein [Gammaproteobacteria bacterium]|nr:YbjQ family protein [Gammaproteobacteria bacterium]
MLCRYCGERLPEHLYLEGIHDECLIKEGVDAGTLEPEEYGYDLFSKASHIKLTTTMTFANHEVEEELDVITAECVFGMNIFRDFFSELTDFFGGRSKASQKVLRDARKTCLEELRIEAAEIGADGVVGIDLDYSEISGKGKSMLFLVASGTAVKFKK